MNMSSIRSARMTKRYVSGLAVCTLLVSSLRATAQSQPAHATFGSPEEAVKSLLEATKAKDKAALERIFGPAAKELASGDEAADAADLAEFSAALAAAHELVKIGDDKVTVMVGKQRHPFAIPLVRQDGKWLFDTAAGKEELLNRRIGENELGAISVCRGYAVAQFEYFSEDRDGDNVMEYAQRVASTPGTKDGLYWETKPDEVPSPMGELAAQARAEGYLKKEDAKVNQPRPYHGYIYKILTRQGEQAPGGKYDYIINGNMVAGFALIAFPVSYDDSGVMTFVINSNGRVYQKDLGEKTGEIAGAMDAYNVDATWTLVKD